MKILVAESAKSHLLFLCACIKEAGHIPISASNGREALEKYDRQQPDFLLLDVELPVIDGITIARLIREKTSSQARWTPIIFVSPMISNESVIKCLEVGGDDYIIKPVSQPVLITKLKAMEKVYNLQQQVDFGNRKLKEISQQDNLTGLANRIKFNEVLKLEWKRAARNIGPLTLCMLSVDQFKPFIDNYGCNAGDKMLVEVAELLNKNVQRPGDLVARYDGEKFVLILPETEFDGVQQLLEKIRKGVENLNIKHDFSTSERRVTISAGSMTIIPSRKFCAAHLNRLLELTERAVDEAKKQVGNRIMSYSQPTDNTEENGIGDLAMLERLSSLMSIDSLHN